MKTKTLLYLGDCTGYLIHKGRHIPIAPNIQIELPADLADELLREKPPRFTDGTPVVASQP